jgi:hypothetical protein
MMNEEVEEEAAVGPGRRWTRLRAVHCRPNFPGMEPKESDREWKGIGPSKPIAFVFHVLPSPVLRRAEDGPQSTALRKNP